MSSNLNTFRSNTNKEKFAFSGNGQTTILSVNDLTQATKIVKVTGEAITLTGASGAIGKIKFGYFPVFDSIGGSIGYFNSATDNDSSVVVNALALDGNQVRIDEYMTDTEIYASLSKGDYAINYIKGILYFKKNTADTAGTIDYIYSTQEVNVTVNTGDTSIGAVEIKDAINDDRAVVSSANTARTTGTNVLIVQGVGADGTVAPTGSAVSNAPFSKITDGTETLSIDASGFGQVNLSTDSVGLAKETTLSTLAGKDFATQTTLATLEGKDFATETTLTTLAGKDFATSTIQTNKTQMTNITDGTNELLIDASGNAKINLTTDSVGLAKASTQTDKTQMTRVTNGTKELEIDANGNAKINLITDSVGLAKETTLSTLAGKDFATETTLATLASKDFATETTLATLASKDFATQTTLASINASVEQVIDDGTNSVKIKELSPVWSRYTDAESLVSAQELTNSYANVGAVIDMRGYNVLQVWLIADVNNSENVKMKSLGKTASDGTDLYDLDDYPEETLWGTGASDFKKSYTFKLNNSIPYIQLQAYAGTVGETAGTLTISITKSYIE